MELGKLGLNNEGIRKRNRSLQSTPFRIISSREQVEFESFPLDLVVRPLNNVVTKQTATGNIYRGRKIHRFTVKLRRPGFENAKISSLT